MKKYRVYNVTGVEKYRSYNVTGMKKYRSYNVTGVKKNRSYNVTGVKKYRSYNVTGVKKYRSYNVTGVKKYRSYNRIYRQEANAGQPEGPADRRLSTGYHTSPTTQSPIGDRPFFFFSDRQPCRSDRQSG